MTVKDQNGKEVWKKVREYSLNDMYLKVPGAKQVPLFMWDITAQEQIHDGIEPGEIDSNTYVIPLSMDTTSVTVDAYFKFLYEEGKEATIHQLTQKVDVQ